MPLHDPCLRRPSPLALGLLALALASAACGRVGGASAPPAIPLVDRFADANVEGTPAASEPPPPVEWRFDGSAPSPGEPSETHAATYGAEALNGIRGLAVRDGRLVGRTSEAPLLALPGPRDPDPTDSFHALEIRLRVSAGERLGISFGGSEPSDREQAIRSAREDPLLAFNIDLRPGETLETYRLTAAHARFILAPPLKWMGSIYIRPTDAADADFELTSVRLISLKEHLAGIPSGVGWQGLGEVYRETLVARAPEAIHFELDLPSDPYLDLSIGTVDHAPHTFRVEVESQGRSRVLLRRTVSTPGAWQDVPVDLGDLTDRHVRLSLALEAERAGAPAFWGSPVIRSRSTPPAGDASSPARDALLGAGRQPPRGVILIVADTLRRDQFQPYGYDGRPNAPVLTRMAAQGVRFDDAIAQGAWTKVSVSSILTSLYPTTHGVLDMPDRLPAAVTTLAEAYRAAGFATFATSSVPFTGRLTNLHQGVEVLHEATSLGELGHSESKTARSYTDRLIDWIDGHRDVPFFALLHVFDPHSPFEPYRPWDSTYLDPDELAAFREDMDRVREFIDAPMMKLEALPTREQIEKSGVDIETYLTRERAWYDASIRAMDVEVGRLLERLEQHGLGEDTLIAFVADHGEEFLEHGRHFHGHNVYGEMVNVPLMLWWPGAVPAGVTVARTVQTIDLMPTLLELSLLPRPAGLQGQSLLPLLADGQPAALGWQSRPAFSERRHAPAAFSWDEEKISALAVVNDGWKLIRNLESPEGRPEFELYDHAADPLNLKDVAAEHPETVARLTRYLEQWQEYAQAARVEADAGTAELSPEELEKLRSLGYVQ